MNWKFWKRSEVPAAGGNGAPKLAKPRDLPEAVGRKMVVEMQLDPDMVWSLRYVSRPAAEGGKAQEFRIFDPGQAARAGLNVKNWTAFDDRPELVRYAGTYDKSAGRVEIHAV